MHPLADGGMRVGEVSLFFGMQFVLCSIELALGAALPARVRAQLRALPAPLKTALTALVICSFGQLFVENLMRADMFGAMRDLYPAAPAVALPRVVGGLSSLL